MKPLQFLKEVSQQIKQISWPDKKTVIKLSTTVILISILSSIALGGFDLLFATTFAKISKSKQDENQILNSLDQEFDLEGIATDSAESLESTSSSLPSN